MELKIRKLSNILKRNSGLKIRFFNAAVWSIIGGLFSRGLSILTFIIVARILGDNLYGQLGIIRSTTNMFIVFASFGLGVTATKYIAQLSENQKNKTSKVESDLR